MRTQAKDEAFLSVFNPQANKAELFSQKVLRFGARSSVHSFIRTSTHFTTPTLEHLRGRLHRCGSSPTAKVFELCVETLFRILDWETSADKDHPFGPISIALGIEFDTTEAKIGFVYLCNTSKRKQELIDLISDILSCGLLTVKECQRLRGRIQFASNQVAGK